MSVSGDLEQLTVRPVLWRAFVFPLLFGLPGGVCIAIVHALATASGTASWPYLIGGTVGVALPFALPPRGRPLELDARALRGCSRWGRRVALALDEVDWRADRDASRAARVFGTRVVRARGGGELVIERWHYPPREMRRFDEEIDRLAEERGGGG